MSTGVTDRERARGELLLVDVSVLHVEAVLGEKRVAVERQLDVGRVRDGVGDEHEEVARHAPLGVLLGLVVRRRVAVKAVKVRLDRDRVRAPTPHRHRHGGSGRLHDPARAVHNLAMDPSVSERARGLFFKNRPGRAEKIQRWVTLYEAALRLLLRPLTDRVDLSRMKKERVRSPSARQPSTSLSSSWSHGWQ